MSNVICSTCVADSKQRYDADHCEPHTRIYKGFQFILIDKCIFSITNILDTASPGEWETLINNDAILLGPSGKLEIGEATQDIAGQEACGNDILDVGVYPYTFETFETDDQYEDEEYWQNVWANRRRFNIAFMGCNGRLTAPYDEIEAIKAAIANPPGVAFDSLGFQLNVTKKPQWVQNSGIGKIGKWVIEGTIKSNDVLVSAEIPGLADILGVDVN